MIVFCWQARTLMPEFEEGSLAPGLRHAMDRHLERCPPCCSRIASDQALTGLLREAALRGSQGSPLSADASLFEQNVMRAARTRKAEGVSATSMPGARSFGAALPLGAAAVMLLAAVAIAVGLRGPAPVGMTRMAFGAPDETASDGVAPAREITFTVRQDLVGDRRGSIPETTYVLEPAPWEGAPSRDDRVIRASF